MSRGYMSDTQARALGLHKLGKVIAVKDCDAPRCFRPSATVNPAHLARILGKQLAEHPDMVRIDVSRAVLYECLALCEAIARMEAEAPAPADRGGEPTAGDAVTPATAGFYILSLDHTRPSDNVFTWWRPNSQGYVWSIDSAGVYQEKEAKEIADTSHGEELAIPVELVEKYASRYLEWDNGLKIPGVREAWDKLKGKG